MIIPLCQTLTEITGSATAVEPFDTSVVTNLDVVHKLSDGDDNSGALVVFMLACSILSVSITSTQHTFMTTDQW